MKAASARVMLTGAGGGIGRATAKALVGSGASVMLVGRSAGRLADQARELACGDADVTWHVAELNDAAAITALTRAAQDWRCNVVVHGAGRPGFGALQTLAPPDIAHVLQTNLLGPMLLTHALLPHLLGLPRAQVICIGSALGRIGLPGYSVYSASKFGLRGFAEALRRELADTGVRVQYLGPRSTRTAFNDRDAQAYQQATGSAVDAPEVVARALLALLADEAAERFIGWPEKAAVRVNGLVPTWLDAGFGRHRRSLPAAHTPTAVLKNAS